MTAADLPSWGSWVLYADLGLLENDAAGLCVDLREIATTKRLTELVFDFATDSEADVAGLVAALSDCLDPLRTLVPPNARRLGPGEAHDLVMMLARRWPVLEAARAAERHTRDI
jgi:hypothetical protein